MYVYRWLLPPRLLDELPPLLLEDDDELLPRLEEPEE
jgi:hypothetical protein